MAEDEDEKDTGSADGSASMSISISIGDCMMMSHCPSSELTTHLKAFKVWVYLFLCSAFPRVCPSMCITPQGLSVGDSDSDSGEPLFLSP